ncbi:aminotransferase class I/II-fold pyridoxal phosphate-dependent enzyme [Stackebrandtia albiflava]|uniref:aminotransferase class I/II-fold pyridoxal phosphate-dependent enzyme n=1 Tax=Stackebrandtia albiflava TaxID=406432 RepID=UPI0011BE9267|nr:aminotransferase class I/II-fold pyridoxal phosphate-dependent enzyme [Stackebrandtia albiflava]
MAEHYQITGAGAADITASVEAGVRDGHLLPGAALPPVRRLAAELGVATATVANAYRTLRQRGVIETAGRHGTRVRHRSALLHRGPQPLPAGTLDLSNGEPDPSLLPDLTAALAAVHPAPGGYADAGPCPGLLDIARDRLARDGVTGALTVTGGALDGIDRVLSAHLRPGDAVGIEDPCWANLRDLVAALGMHPYPMPVDREGPTAEGLADALRGGARAVILTSRAHNPTGADISAARALRLRALLERHPDTLVIEDDHWAELSTRPLHPVADAATHWLFLRSVSKPYGPDLRLAVACGDHDTVTRLEGRMRLGSGWVSTVLQQVVAALMNDPAAARTIRNASRTYRDRRQALIAALAARGVPAIGDSGLNVWIPVTDETTTVTALRDRGYAVAAGAAHRLQSPPGVRVTVTNLPDHRLGDLADAIAAGLRPHRSRA